MSRSLTSALRAYGARVGEDGSIRDLEGNPLGVHVKRYGATYHWTSLTGNRIGTCGPQFNALLRFIGSQLGWRLT